MLNPSMKKKRKQVSVEEEIRRDCRYPSDDRDLRPRESEARGREKLLRGGN